MLLGCHNACLCRRCARNQKAIDIDIAPLGSWEDLIRVSVVGSEIAPCGKVQAPGITFSVLIYQGMYTVTLDLLKIYRSWYRLFSGGD